MCIKSPVSSLVVQMHFGHWLCQWSLAEAMGVALGTALWWTVGDFVCPCRSGWDFSLESHLA